MKQLPEGILKVVELRPYTEADLNFIYNAWLRSYRNHPSMRLMTNDVYFSNHKHTVTKLIVNNHVDILCNKEEPDQIYGFVCYTRTPDNHIIHYMYVKYNYRRMGIGAYLLDHAVGQGIIGDATFENPVKIYTTHQPTSKIQQKLPAGIKLYYNPYI